MEELEVEDVDKPGLVNAMESVEAKPESYTDDSRPDVTDPKWTDYVLGQLEDDEVFNGCPRVDGLRRIAVKLLGKLITSIPVDSKVDQFKDGHRATVSWKIVFQEHETNDILEFGDVADVFLMYGDREKSNCDDRFGRFAPAVAATRAEGRALRKALMLRKVVTAEEMASSNGEDKPEPINSTQVRFAKMVAERLHIDLLKLIKAKNSRYNKLEDMTRVDAARLNKFLSDVQNGSEKIDDKYLIKEDDE
jgi:hypothetical protein